MCGVVFGCMAPTHIQAVQQSIASVTTLERIGLNDETFPIGHLVCAGTERIRTDFIDSGGLPVKRAKR